MNRLFQVLCGSVLALLIAVTVLAQIDEDELLPVEEAFALSAAAAGPTEIRLRWNVAEGYYLYRERISLRSLDPAVTLSEPVLPPGELIDDAFFGRVQIWRGQADVLVGVEGAAPGSRVRIAVRSQGCADLGVCYPPHEQIVELALAQAAPAASPPLSETAPGTSLGLPGLAPQPLPEEQAFMLEAIADGADRLLLRWTMPPGYYLYRERSHLRLLSGEGVLPGMLQWPRGLDIVDEHFGASEVYFESVEVPVALARSTRSAQPIRLEVGFQGCLQDGICYPPMRRELSIDLPAVVAGPLPLRPGAAPALSGPRLEALSEARPSPGLQSEQDRLASALGSGQRWLALLSFFGLGLLLAFTPCVLPMLPILSGLIAGQGAALGTRRALLLSTVYVLAMALTYTAFGVLAGLTGYNLQAAFQNPWVLSAFALVFVLLALAMFGLYELQVPVRLQNWLDRLGHARRGGTLSGVALMGGLSALIVGPCVAPPLMGALIYIGQTGDPVFGGAALFALSIGMGLPLIAWGASAGHLLPRAGRWMEAVKHFFGVLLLLVALYLMERVLDPIWIMLLLGTLLIASGVHLGAIDRLPARASGWQRSAKALGFVLLVLGVIQLIGVASGGRDWTQPLSSLRVAEGSAAASAPGPAFAKIESSAELDRELLAAAARGQPVMLDFYADWCTDCKRMQRQTFSDPEVRAVLAQARLLKADVTANDADDQALLRRFGLIGPPAILFFDRNGNELRHLRTQGFVRAPEFARIAQAGFSLEEITPCPAEGFC